jgi:hypothetical protein
LEGAGVVDRESVGAAIDDQDVFGVGSEAGLDGFGVGMGAAVNLARGSVDFDELVGGGRGGVDAIAGLREVERVRREPDRNLRNPAGARVDDEDGAAGVGDAPDFVARGVFAEIGDAKADRNFRDGLKFGEIDDGERALGGGDVGVHVEVGTEEGRAVFAEKENRGEDKKNDEDEINAWAFGGGHCVS